MDEEQPDESEAPDPPGEHRPPEGQEETPSPSPPSKRRRPRWSPYTAPWPAVDMTRDIRRLQKSVSQASDAAQSALHTAGIAESLGFLTQRAVDSMALPPSGWVDLQRLVPGPELARTEALDIARRLRWVQPSVAERLEGLEPENWRGEHLMYEDMLPVMEEGIPLVWVPSADVIRALLAEPDPAARRRALADNATAVTDYCRQALGKVDRSDLTPQTGHLHECLELVERGTTAAAQALATNVFDTVLRALVRAEPTLGDKRGYFSYGVLKDKLEQATMETVIGQFRAFCLHTCVHAAGDTYFGPPVPEEYSRHATSHAVGPTQYTLANALAAVMLAVGLLRELQETQRPLTQAD